MKKNYYLTHEVSDMLFLYKHYLNIPMRFFIDEENITLGTTDFGVLTLSVRENNKKDLTTFNYIFFNDLSIRIR